VAVNEFFMLAGALFFCETSSACMECNSCKTVLRGSNPDVIHINPAGEKMKVEDVRALTSTAYIKPLSGRKLYFVHRADLMRADAQNKLLKTLEEPPAGVTIFLGVANESAMLETVKSRCRIIHLDYFDRKTLLGAVKKLGASDRSADVAASCGEGMLGKAKAIAESGEYAEMFGGAVKMLGTLKRSTEVIKLDGMPFLEGKPQEFLSVLSVILRDILMLKAGQGGDGFMAESVVEIAGDFSLEAAARSIMLANDMRKKLQLNVNTLACIDSLMFSILEAKFKYK
jgi:DNA polymerase-3 subunit delta'